MTSQPVVVSAPGKVLFAGGFLILDRAHTGLVFSLNARIHVHIQEDSPREVPSITVSSPQFKDATWSYLWKPDEGQLDQTTVPSSTSRANPFVQTALEYALIYLSHLQNSNSILLLRITILADDSYYSTSPTSRTGHFPNFDVALHDAHKTGLGSSAALVTSLTTALLVFLGGNLFHNLTDPTTQKRIHSLAQASHCAAQGKVGSGFDVAAAVYGSCLYRRFSPVILSNLGDSHSPDFGERLHRCVEDRDPNQAWDVEVSSKAVEIPHPLLLLMCDVDCGSETPGMVKKVLAWRKENPEEALLLWNALQQGTEDLCRSLTELVKTDVGGLTMYDQKKLSDIIQTIRIMVRDMSAKSQVPIEPPVITELLDYCTGLPGVVGGVAPGAGGYDAVALLVRNDVEVVRDLEARLKDWKPSKKGEEGATIGKVSLLKVQQGWDGVRMEDLSRYESWVR